MTFWQIAILLVYAVGLAIGQVLFKLAAQGWPRSGGLVDRMLTLLLNPWLILAVATYAGLSLLWVWILSQVPLTRAYPFIMITFVATMLAGVLFFHEALSRTQLAGAGLILAGLALLAR